MGREWVEVESCPTYGPAWPSRQATVNWRDDVSVLSGGIRSWRIRTSLPGVVLSGDSSQNREALIHEEKDSVILALGLQMGDSGAGPSSVCLFGAFGWSPSLLRATPPPGEWSYYTSSTEPLSVSSELRFVMF